MCDMKNRTERGELRQHASQKEQEKAGDCRKWRFAVIAFQTRCFDCGFHDRT